MYNPIRVPRRHGRERHGYARPVVIAALTAAALVWSAGTADAQTTDAGGTADTSSSVAPGDATVGVDPVTDPGSPTDPATDTVPPTDPATAPSAPTTTVTDPATPADQPTDPGTPTDPITPTDPAPPTDPGPIYPRTPLWVYGHSFTTSPGMIDTPGSEWMPELAHDVGMPSWRTFGVSSSRLIDTYGDLVRHAPRGTVPGSAWQVTRRGVVVLQSEFNDMLDAAAGNVQRAMPLNGTAVSNYGQTLQSSLAFLAASSRGDWSTASGSRGWVAAAGPAYAGGSLVWTTRPGAYREMTVDVGASGTVWVVTWDVSGAVRNPYNGAAAISVDGRLRVTVPARKAPWESIWSRRAGGYANTAGPRATRISGLSPGRHVLRVTKADRGRGAVCLDQVLVQSAAPLPVIVVKDPAPLTVGNWVTLPANRSTLMANQPLLDAQIDSVVAQFPNATTATLAGMPADDYGRDGLHPSDSGMRFEAAVLAEAFRRQVNGYDVPGMYE